MKRLFIWMLLVAAGCAPSSNPPVIPKGTRQVAIHITQAESNSYDTEFQRVKTLGVDVVPITLPWNVLETPTGFDFSLLAIINTYYPANHVKVSLNVTPVYEISSSMPTDLLSRRFNDPLVKTRFNALLDSIHQKLPAAQINNFILGLEVDNYLNGNPSAWADYQAFYDSARTHIRKIWGAAMKVGVETTFPSATGTSKAQILALNTHSDMMVLSYYPLNSDFTVRAPTDVHADVSAVISLYPSMPVFIVECGYPTSAACNSTEAQQQQFIIEMFKLWDAHANSLNFMGFLWLTDLSDAVANQYVSAYGGGNPGAQNAFRGYLQTTGLRTYTGNGSDKAGFTQLKKELAVRGW